MHICTYVCVCVGHETRRGERGGDLNSVGKELTMKYV